jgi:hypothetical protein
MKIIILGVIPFPFNWVPQRVGRVRAAAFVAAQRSFHLIGFPSEWGAKELGVKASGGYDVSI